MRSARQESVDRVDVSAYELALEIRYRRHTLSRLLLLKLLRPNNIVRKRKESSVSRLGVMIQRSKYKRLAGQEQRAILWFLLVKSLSFSSNKERGI